MKVSLFLFLVVSSFLAFSSCAEPDSVPQRVLLSSPDGVLELRSGISVDGQLVYCLGTRGDSTRYLGYARLGIRVTGADFTDTLHIVDTASAVGRTAYTLSVGKQISVDKPFRSLTLSLLNSADQPLDVEFKLYDDGLAFRYRLDQLPGDSLVVTEERTEFMLSEGARVWRQPYDTVTQFSPGYEQYWVSVQASSPAPSDRGYVVPLYAYRDSAHVLIHESGIGKDYYASHLKNDGNLYRLAKPLPEEAMGLYDTLATMRSTRSTPWRVVMAGPTPQSIVGNTLVTDVSPEATFEPWAEMAPGRAAWSWWSDWDSPQDYAKQVRFVDFAAEQGWEYLLVDANWERMRGGDVGQLAAYAKTKGVGVWLWYNSGGPHNTVTEGPRDSMHAAGPRQREFARIAALGIVGVKVDFFQSDKQGVVRQYAEILEDAAAAKIMVNFHGCTAPRGWTRTYPNLMTMEAVVGAESYEFKQGFPERTPVQHTVLPLTRNAVGPMDYTPVTFTNRKYPHVTTDAHELALSVLFESGVIHYADDVDKYRALPEEVQRYLTTVPTVWDKSYYSGGEPGEWLAISRKREGRWYVAIVNGTNEARVVELGYPFGELEVVPWTIFKDGDGLEVETLSSVLPRTITLEPYGGYVAFGPE